MDINKTTKISLLEMMQRKKTDWEADSKDHSKEIEQVENDIALIKNTKGDNIKEMYNSASTLRNKYMNIKTAIEVSATFTSITGLCTTLFSLASASNNRTCTVAIAGGVAMAAGIASGIFFSSKQEKKESMQNATLDALDKWKQYVTKQPCKEQQINLSLSN